MQSFNPSNLDILRKEMDAALQAVATKHGVVIRWGSGRYTDSNATLKMDLAVTAPTGEILTKEVTDFKAMAFRYGLKPEHLGMSFKHSSVDFTITGLKTRCHKAPILAKSSKDGKIYRFAASLVNVAMIGK